MLQSTQSRIQVNQPLLDSAFICSNVPVARPVPLTTIPKSGRKRIATMKVQELHLQKKKATGGTKKTPTEAEN
jgi:hypothetical protein